MLKTSNKKAKEVKNNDNNKTKPSRDPPLTGALGTTPRLSHVVYILCKLSSLIYGIPWLHAMLAGYAPRGQGI